MSWFDKLLPPKIKISKGTEKKAVPEGLWHKCQGCGAVLYMAEVESNSNVCPKCGYHMRIGARRRLSFFIFNRWGFSCENIFVINFFFRDSGVWRWQLRHTVILQRTVSGEIDC